MFCFLATVNVGAAPGAFFSAMDMQQISDLSQVPPHSFAYRVATGGRYFYHTIDLNDLVYRTKNVFSLEGIDVDLQELLVKNIYHSRGAVGTNNYISEVIIHKDFILLDVHRTIYFEVNNRIVSLDAMKTPPGLVVLTGGGGNISLFSQVGDSLVEKGRLPITIIVGSTPEFFIVRQQGHIFRQLRVWSEPRVITRKDIVLKEIPNVSIVRRRFAVDIDNIESDSAKIRHLDSLSGEVRNEIKGQQAMRDYFVSMLRNKVEPILPREDFETSQGFEFREAIYKREYEAVLAAGLARNNFDVLLEEANNRLALLESYKNSILNKPQDVSLYERVDGAFFLNISTTLGKNMPPFTYLQAPARLFGGAGNIEYIKNVGFVSILGSLGASYSIWKFNSLYEDRSNLKEIKAGIGIGLPVVRDEKRLLMLNIKGVICYFQYVINGFSIYEAETLAESVQRYRLYGREVAFGAETGITYFFSNLPVSIFLKYGYNNRDFGDLRLGFGLPLVFIPRF